MARPRFDLIRRIRRFYRLRDDHPSFVWTRTRTYKRRLEQVKNAWIIAGVIMLASGNIAAVLLLTGFMGFMSLAYLEQESPPEQ